EGENTHTPERQGRTIKQVDRQEIGAAGLRIIPQGHLGVIAYPGWLSRLMLHCIQEPAAADWIAGLGNSDALIEWPGARSPRKGEIAYHPAIGDLIIESKWVAVVLVVAARGTISQRGKQRIEGCDGAEWVARLIKNSKHGIDRIDVMIRAHIAVAVSREATAPTLRCSNSIKRQQRPRHRGRWPPNPFEQRLELLVASREWRWRSVFGEWIPGQTALLNLSLGCDVRKIS